ncbi:hypothetical protein QTO34_012439 [Cnephaeus nilssonii]|uniref:Potassium channel domain-containing protein n=1 Tax=Cnephaeus nilssonii TaxID=3371016 RepID=A0AA40HBV7_CNENI|nr:hypothetical protein QTO34_012439 [Eptesicus nilssonii]
MNQEVTVRFPVRAHARVAGSIPSYGHTVPLSDGGKAFCIVYSIIGIPFTLLFLTAVVQRVTIHVTRRPVLYVHLRWGFSKQLVALVHAVLLGVATVSCFFFIPAAVFSVLEDDWNFLESFYFCFISLSTIGLGDYVPGEGYNQKFRELYKLGITCEYPVPAPRPRDPGRQPRSPCSAHGRPFLEAPGGVLMDTVSVRRHCLIGSGFPLQNAACYLLLGLVAMLVVLETFCELHELKKFRKMFYVKKDKDEDQVHIMEHDQLSFSSITDQAGPAGRRTRSRTSPLWARSRPPSPMAPTALSERGLVPRTGRGGAGRGFAVCVFRRI